MKKLPALLLLLTALSFGIETNFNYKINNDEFLYKKRIMEDELLKKDFESIVALKSFLVYNEFTSSNLFIHFKLTDDSGQSHTQQFILLQTTAGTPTMYEIQKRYLYNLESDNPYYDLDTFISREVGGVDAKKDQYNLPTTFDYFKIEDFLKYSYSHTLKFVLRNKLSVIEKRVNTNSFYLSFGTGGVPTITTTNTNTTISNQDKIPLLFSFSKGFDLSKNADFKEDVRKADLTTETRYINNEQLVHDKNLEIEKSPAFFGLIKPSDNFRLTFSHIETDPGTGAETEVKNTVSIEEFYIIKAEVELVE